MAVTPIPGNCGHCGLDAEHQNHSFLCFHCGKWSEMDGTPIAGNAHHRANYSKTFPEANGHGIDEFRKD
jgi:hypothetical protein